MNKIAKRFGKLSGTILTIGIILFATGAVIKWDWLLFTGIVVAVAGLAANKFMQI